MKQSLRVVRLGLMVAAVDLTVSVGYWGALGVTPARVLASIAGWVVAVESVAAPAAWLVGVLVMCSIYVAMVGGLALGVALRPVSRSRWLPVGVLYGVTAYVACYQWWVPALIYPARLSASPVWMAACAGLHVFVFGPWMAWSVIGLHDASARTEGTRIFASQAATPSRGIRQAHPERARRVAG